MSSPILGNSLSPPSETPESISKKRKLDEMESLDSEPTKMPTERVATIVELFPDADTTLKVGLGKDALDIKVSSVILSLSSKVFAAMLNSSFIEGATKIVELKEDDPQIVLLFCQIVHYRNNAIKDVEGKHLRALTTLADMRGCEAALKPWMMFTLDEYRKWSEAVVSIRAGSLAFPSSILGFTLEDLIAIAYVFDVPGLFWQTTWAYTATTCLHTESLAADCQNGFVPIQCSGGSFLCTRDQYVQSFLKQIYEHVTERLTDKIPSSFVVGCTGRLARYGYFMYRLTDHKVGPTNLEHYSESWAKAIGTVEFIAKDTGGWHLTSLVWPDPCASSDCGYCTRDINRSLLSLVFRERRKRLGACLKCLQENGEVSLGNEENCLKHAPPKQAVPNDEEESDSDSD